MRLISLLTCGLPLVLCFLLFAQNPTDEGGSLELAFEDGTEASGLGAFTLVSGSAEKNYLFEGMSGGVCLLDYDRDGFLDVYFVNGGTVESFKSGSPSGLRNALTRASNVGLALVGALQVGQRVLKLLLGQIERAQIEMGVGVVGLK